MYKITCCRVGDKHVNKLAKGKFIRKFETLDEFAAYFENSKRNIWFPNLQKELMRKEIRILNRKAEAIRRKRKCKNLSCIRISVANNNNNMGL